MNISTLPNIYGHKAKYYMAMYFIIKVLRSIKCWGVSSVWVCMFVLGLSNTAISVSQSIICLTFVIWIIKHQMLVYKDTKSYTINK